MLASIFFVLAEFTAPMWCGWLSTEFTVGRKFKKFQAKKTREINFFFMKSHFWQFYVNYFPVQKLILGHFWNFKNWNLVKKILVKLIFFISRVFLAWTFFYIFWPTVQSSVETQPVFIVNCDYFFKACLLLVDVAIWHRIKES